MPARLMLIALALIGAATQAAGAQGPDLRQAADIVARRHIAAPDAAAFDVSNPAAFDASLRRVLGAQDPYTRLVPPDELRALKTRDVRKSVGVNALLVDLDADGVLIAPNAQSPLADPTGVADVFVLMSINASPPIDVDDARERLRGEAGQTVALRLADLRTGEASTVRLNRERFNYPYVEPVPLNVGDGTMIDVVRLNTFVTGSTARRLELTIDKVRRAGRPLVIDLRFNRGGELDEVFDVANLFVPSGSLLATRLNRDGAKQAFRSGDRSKSVDPRDIILLIGPDTASAAEVFARALAASGATTVGAATFGKCSGQDVEALDNGWAVMVTTTIILDPQGSRCDGAGLVPTVAAPSAEPAFLYDTRALVDAALRARGEAPLAGTPARSGPPPSWAAAATTTSPASAPNDAASAATSIEGWYACRTRPLESADAARTLARLLDIGFGRIGQIEGLVVGETACLGPFDDEAQAAAAAASIDLEPDETYAARRF